MVHSALENYLRDGTELPSSLPVGLQDALNLITPIYLEQRLYCPTLQFTGQLDCFGVVGGELAIVDFKTTKKSVKVVKPEWLAQLAAYRYLLKTNGMGIANKGLLLQIAPDHVRVLDISTEDLRQGWRLFLCALDLYRGLN